MSVFDIPVKQTGDTVTAEEMNDIVAASRTYKTYIALISQSGTDAPIADVLNSNDSNFLGNIVWTRDVQGYYLGTLAGAFLPSKTYAVLYENFPIFNKCYIDVNSIDDVFIRTVDKNDYSVLMDGALGLNPIEIRVYQN